MIMVKTYKLWKESRLAWDFAGKLVQITAGLRHVINLKSTPDFFSIVRRAHCAMRIILMVCKDLYFHAFADVGIVNLSTVASIGNINT